VTVFWENEQITIAHKIPVVKKNLFIAFIN